MDKHGADIVTKTMALSMAEFHWSLAKFLGREVRETQVAVTIGAGRVEIAFAALPEARLGGLLVLPQALVTLSFHDVSADERAAFLRRFDVAFQRGGG